MDVQGILEEIQLLKGRGRDILKGDTGANATLDRLYETVYREKIKRGCRDCSMVAYGKLIRLNKNQIKIMAEQKFKLKPSKAIQLKFGSAEMVSNENLTDAVAIRLLRQRPYLVKEFADYPKNAKGELVLPAEKKATAAGSGNKGGKTGSASAKGKSTAAGSGKETEEPAEVESPEHEPEVKE